MDSTFKSQTILSLCTGMRGIETGIESVIGPITVAAYVEIEAFIIFNLVRQMEQGVVDAAPVWTDIKTFPSKQFHNKIHGIIGGYPCQPFSVAGKLAGTEDPRHLWPYIEQSIKHIQPEWCFFENVSNHLNVGYREVRQSLEKMGYSVKEGIFSAEEVGAPHIRKRLFILALANTNRNEHKGEYANTGSNSVASRTESETQERKRVWVQPSSGSEDMGYSFGQGLERHARNVGSKERRKEPNRSITKASFPLGQGHEQHEWEAPRTTEPGLGCTIDGYNFRTDLLRMYGNGVVHQTSAWAFRDLLRKHLYE